MLPSVVVGILFMLIAALSSATLGAKDTAKANRLALKQQAQSVVVQAATDFLRETGALPLSLAQLAATPGFEYVQPHTTGANRVSYAISDVFPRLQTGGMSGYQAPYRQAAIFAPVDTTLAESTFLDASNNKCSAAGPGAFSTVATWCGDKLRGPLTILSEREGTGATEALAQAAQKVTADKLRIRYDAMLKAGFTSFAYPAAASAIFLWSVAVPAPSTTSTVGAIASQCKGTFTWTPAPTTRQGIPLDCADLYNYFGNPVSYRRISTTQAVLTSNSRYPPASGVGQAVITTTSP